MFRCISSCGILAFRISFCKIDLSLKNEKSIWNMWGFKLFQIAADALQTKKMLPTSPN
jgi:hypothetical protein